MAKKKYRGRVISRTYAKSSKSEHQAVMLDTGQKELKLRRAGGNPFVDKVLEKLVGLSVECTGVQDGKLLIIDSWKETDDEFPLENNATSTKSASKGGNQSSETDSTQTPSSKQPPSDRASQASKKPRKKKKND